MWGQLGKLMSKPSEFLRIRQSSSVQAHKVLTDGWIIEKVSVFTDYHLVLLRGVVFNAATLLHAAACNSNVPYVKKMCWKRQRVKSIQHYFYGKTWLSVWEMHLNKLHFSTTHTLEGTLRSDTASHNSTHIITWFHLNRALCCHQTPSALFNLEICTRVILIKILTCSLPTAKSTIT